tara:strand:+ start:9068 stop:9679 length:612 start_codon:yes stop_codon:yes gene_type:complete
MRLNQIRDNEGARKRRIRVGRGEGSGKGKTAGRGVKGQKSRSGVSVLGFEGGQMPIFRRTPKRGFNNNFAKHFEIVNLGKLQDAVDAGKFGNLKIIDYKALASAGLTRGNKDGVRVLGNGDVKTALTLEVNGASKSALEAIERVGGKVVLPQPTKTELLSQEKSEKRRLKRQNIKSNEEKKQPISSSDNGDSAEVDKKPNQNE